MIQSSSQGCQTESLDNIDVFYLFILTSISFIIRYWRISLPDSIVFDEVYFGNFTNYYIQSRFYHDIHPPLAKLIMFYFAKLSDYDGQMSFQHNKNGYPQPDYVQLRIIPATFSALVFPLIYISLRLSSFSHSSSICASIIAVCDISLGTEGRHILTDGILHFFTCLHIAVLCYTVSIKPKFRSSLYFFVWHLFTGLTLGAACACKNTAWGLTVFDAFCYIIHISDIISIRKHRNQMNSIEKSNNFRERGNQGIEFFENEGIGGDIYDYLFDVGFFGLTLAIIAFFVYCASFFTHFILLPYAGTGYYYLNSDMKKQMLSDGSKTCANQNVTKRQGPIRANYDESLDECVTSGLFAIRIQSPSLLSRTFLLSIRMHKGNMNIQGFHDSQSFPKHWPLMTSVTVYFWGRKGCEIRCLGNIIVYSMALFGICASSLIFLINLSRLIYIHGKASFSHVLGSRPLFNEKWVKLFRFVVGYCVSYFPFYWIPRTLYLYHYLIPLIFGCISFGGMLDILVKGKIRGICIAIICLMCIFGFWLWSPYMYGTQPHDKEIMIWSRRWIDGDEDHIKARLSRKSN